MARTTRPKWELPNSLERIGPRQVYLPKTHHEMTTNTHSIPARSSPGSTRTAPSVDYQDGGEKWNTGGHLAPLHKIRSRDTFIVGTWNVRTLAAEGKLEELSHEMEHY